MFDKQEKGNTVYLFHFGAYPINETFASDVFVKQVDGGMRETDLTLRVGTHTLDV